MSEKKAAHVDDVTRHFENGRLPRLDLPMLPRDVHRVTGTLRKVLCTSFNYVKKYPVKLEKYIEVLKYACNFAMAYQHYVAEQKAEREAKLAEEAAKEVEVANEDSTGNSNL